MIEYIILYCKLRGLRPAGRPHACKTHLPEDEMLEIISPAGSAEGVIAAVQNGADAVYFGFERNNARLDARNLNENEIYKAAEYCRVRGVKTYITLNSFAFDVELKDIAELARKAARCGANGLVVSDLGVMRAVRQAAPSMEIIAGEAMGIHSLEGAKVAAAMGAAYVTLSALLPFKEIKRICASSPAGVLIPAHGPICVSYAGQCHLSAFTDRKSDCRGACAQPCRRRYGAGTHAVEYPLGLKDTCLVNHLSELTDAGAKGIVIEGRTRRPEYSAVVTGIYSKALRDGRRQADDDIRAMSRAFSGQGFNDGYFTGKKGPHMFGSGGESETESRVVFNTARRNYLNGELQRVPVRFFCALKEGETMKLAAMDDRGFTASAEGLVPEKAFNRELTAAALRTQLHNTGGTPFLCAGVRSSVDRGLTLPVSAIGEVKRRVLVDILRQREAFTPGETGEFIPGCEDLKRTDPPVITVSVLKASQLSRELLKLGPEIIYIPLEEAADAAGVLSRYLKTVKTKLAVVLPHVIHDGERTKVRELMKKAREAGIDQALAGNIGQILFARSLGFSVRGDYGLNAFNSHTLRTLRDMGLESAALPFEMKLSGIRDMAKPLDTELMAYGRLPLMVTESCIIHDCMGVCTCDNFSGLSDGSGANYPVVKEFGCRNILLGSRKLFMADRIGDLNALGVWAIRLSFTTESARECVSVMSAFLGESDYKPSGSTHGVYYRGVQ